MYLSFKLSDLKAKGDTKTYIHLGWRKGSFIGQENRLCLQVQVLAPTPRGTPQGQPEVVSNILYPPLTLLWLEGWLCR